MLTGWENTFVHWLTTLPFPFLLPFLGAIIGGEETIIVITIIAVSTGFVSIPILLLFSFLGTSVKDACVFTFGKYSIKWLERKPKVHEQFEKIGHFFNRVTHKNYFLTLFITKFLYGVRVLTIFYVGRQGMTLPTFIFYNIFVTGVWICVTCGIGYLAAEGLVSATKIFGDVSYALGLLAIAAIAIYAIRLWISRRLVEDENQ